jgi:prephenate dehydrogenase
MSRSERAVHAVSTSGASPRGDAEPPFRTIAIVGVGLIGGSVGLAARARWPGLEVVGIDRRDVLREALSFGAVTRTSSELEAVAGAELIVLAAPVTKNVALLADVAVHVGPQSLVTDVGSTKRTIVAAARTAATATGARLTFVGGHPLAGAAVSGVHAARAQLFRGRPWILTPADDADPAYVDRLRRFVIGLGALPEVVDADHHDRLVAFVSHLPQLVASGLLHTVGEAVGDKGLALSGPGLADTTRLASSPPHIWTEIFQSNADYVEAAVDDLIQLLGALKADLRSPRQVASVLESAARWRSALRRVGEAPRDARDT